MKHFRCVLLLAAVTPSLLLANSKKMTVAELRDLLTGLNAAGKSDEQIANQLEEIELSEELTPTAMNGMVTLVSGQLSTEQMYVLEARSAMLAPPATDLPRTAPLDAAAQRDLLAKAQDYAARTYPQLPRLTAARLVARFQDGAKTIQAFAGTNIKIKSDDEPVAEHVTHSAHLVNARTDKVEIDKGLEKPGAKDTTPWGRNGLVNSMLPPLPLDLLTSEAVASGKPKFVRWETITGHRTAVFAFAVGKKNSHYAINYCCFPDTSTVGNFLFGGRGTGAGPSSSAGGNLAASPFSHPAGNGNISYVSDWNPFKAKSGYHGELFLDPDSGGVLRTIVEAEFKPPSFVHYEDIRIDYAPTPLGENRLYVPVRSFINAEVVPNGDSFVKRYAVRHQYVIEEYKDLQAPDGSYKVAVLTSPGGKIGGPPGGMAPEPGASLALIGAEGEGTPPEGFPSVETLSRPDGPLDITAAANATQRPSDDEIKTLLAEAEQSANSYWDSLPNFTCRQVTQRFAGSGRGNKWEEVDTVTGRLDYYDRQEEWEFLEYEKNHKKSHESNPDIANGISGYGIFGDVIRGLFRPSAKPEISWFETDTLGDRSVQVFKYSIAKENSKLYLRAGPMEVENVGYHGMVYIDGVTHGVRRITEITDGAPRNYPIYETLISADYDYVSIGDQQYLLPIGAQIILRQGNRKGHLDLNEIRFSDFHRFRSTAKILSGTPTSPN